MDECQGGRSNNEVSLRAFFAQRDGFEKGLALGLAGAVLSFAICCIWTPLLVRGIGIQLAVLFAWATFLERPESTQNLH